MENIDQNWIQRFTAEHGRPPRILHMGNVCNNAYQTAKMLNAAGADCDVYNADDYYIMANPEWDETEITGNLGNLYFPRLHRVNLHGFKRPRWFAHGPMPYVLEYLIAKRRGEVAKANRLWRKLERTRRRISFKSNSPLGPAVAKMEKVPEQIRGFFISHFYYLGCVIAEAFTKPGLFLRRIRHKLGLLPAEQSEALLAYDEAARGKKREEMLASIVDQQVLQRVLKDAETLFPDRTIQFDTELESYMYCLKQLRELLSHYDVVQAYASQTLWPYLAGFENYVGYELGTLRDYVYEENDFSRLTLLGFARAKAIYVTNIDCYQSAQYIAGQTGAGVVCGLHGIDVERTIQKMKDTIPQPDFDSRFGVPKNVPLFYSPSRHTYLHGEGVFLKGEEKVVGAAARLAEEGFAFRLSLSAWGNDIDMVKELVACHPKLVKMVVWNPPLAKEEFYLALRDADAVLDQFYLNGYGGIFIEALCANSAVLITCSSGGNPVERFFADFPPYLPADSEEDIYAAMKQVLTQPQKTKALAQTGREWVRNNHSARNICKKCCEAYEYLDPCYQYDSLKGTL